MQKLNASDHISLLKKASLELEAMRKPPSAVIMNRADIVQHVTASSSTNAFNFKTSRKQLSLPLEKNLSNETVGKLTCLTLERKNIIDSKPQPTKYCRIQSDVTDYHSSKSSEHKFPTSCLKLLLSLPGNNLCVDCGAKHPEWASVSYGILLCLQCCGRHRRLGVQISFVRSIHMDTWSHSQILSMLEGGNDQLTCFFRRHFITPEDKPNISGKISNSTSIFERRYETKAAQFYRSNLSAHVKHLISKGAYKGREATRRRKIEKQKNHNSSIGNREVV